MSFAGSRSIPALDSFVSRMEGDMQHLTVRFLIAVLTFMIGVGAATVWLYHRTQTVKTLENPTTNRAPEPQVEPPVANQERLAEESPEEKAIRIAEEFIAQNGYTDLPPAKDKLSYETVETASSVDEMLKWRHGTLDRKAYGIIYRGRMGTKGGRTVVFRVNPRYGKEWDEWGRAVTMDKDFKNIRVEHKMFPLANVDKKL